MQSKGAQYSKVFRKAGIAWGKGDMQKAIDTLAAGLALAQQQGDLDVARILQQDLERYQRLIRGGEMDLSS
jgi:hypothetical protein